MRYFDSRYVELYNLPKETVLPYISKLIFSGKLEEFDLELLDYLWVPTEMMPEDVFECLFLIQYSMLYNNVNDIDFTGYKDEISRVYNGNVNWEKTRAWNTLAYNRIVIRVRQFGWDILPHKLGVLSLQMNLKLIKNEEHRKVYEELIDILYMVKGVQPMFFEELSYEELIRMCYDAYSYRVSSKEIIYNHTLVKFADCIINMTYSE